MLASAGIGCTPITAMLHHLAATGSTRRVLLLHADRSEPDHALRTDMEALTAALPNGDKIFWYEDGERGRAGRIDLAEVDDPRGRGRLPVRAAAVHAGRRGPSSSKGESRRGDIHYEVFGPDLWLAAS